MGKHYQVVLLQWSPIWPGAYLYYVIACNQNEQLQEC